MKDAQLKLLAEMIGEQFRRTLVQQTPEIVRAMMDIPRRENVGRAYAQNRGVTGHDISVGASETMAAIPRARSLAGREEIFILILHASQSLYLGKTRGIPQLVAKVSARLGRQARLYLIVLDFCVESEVL